MAGFAIPRLVIFGLVTIFAFAVLGVDAHVTSIFAKSGTTIPIEGMGLATALFTILSLPAIVFSPKGSFPTTVLFESIWLFILWVFWLTTAALASNLRITVMKELGPKGCSQLRDDGLAVCMELPAIEGISYVNWLLRAYIPFTSNPPTSHLPLPPSCREAVTRPNPEFDDISASFRYDPI
ncbi:hypothetical protein PTI98_010523 [Pleurotus ostreatus]|nr:hypothetical protein PTI98_010523 [Pleurotus ostreatus]